MRADVCWLANVIAWCPFIDAAHATTGSTNLENYAVQHFTILSHFKHKTQRNTCKLIIFVRTAMLDSQPVTFCLALDSQCSEALHRTMLVWLLHHQSYIICFITFVTNHALESASDDLVVKQKMLCLLFWNQLKNYVYF